MKKQITPEVSSYLASLGRKGGAARKQALTQEERTAIARKAGRARQEKAHQQKGAKK